MEPAYLNFDGLMNLIPSLHGTENIHAGIRPYGFHAGNAMALYVYPYLLCKYFKKTKIEPSFTFYISINDWEQDALSGPDIRKYPFNVYPANTSLQYTDDEEGCCPTIVDHWQPIIEYNISKLKNHFPKINFIFIRNSSLKDDSYFKQILIDTINNPEKIAHICKKYSGKEVLKTPLTYGGAICPKCSSAHGSTKVINDNIFWRCDKCLYKTKKEYAKFDYWWYHKPLLTARLKIFNIDLTISGSDHHSEGDYEIRKTLIETYDPTIKIPKMLFTPLVLALDGEKMSKSRNNTAFVKLDEFINQADHNHDSEIMVDPIYIKENIDTPINNYHG